MFAMGGTKFKLSRDVVAPGLLADADDLRWMERRLNASLGEEFHSDGTEVTCEDDLLRITRESCAEYAARFRDVHGIRIPPDRLPADELVDPRQVAVFVEYCRSQVRGRIRLVTVPAMLRKFLGIR